MTNNDKIGALRDEHNLTTREIAKILGVSIYTARSWFYAADNPNRRACPAMALELLAIKTGDTDTDSVEQFTRKQAF